MKIRHEDTIEKYDMRMLCLKILWHTNMTGKHYCMNISQHEDNGINILRNEDSAV